MPNQINASLYHSRRTHLILLSGLLSLELSFGHAGAFRLLLGLLALVTPASHRVCFCAKAMQACV